MSSEFERLIGRTVLDKEFRDQLLQDPEGTARSAGFSLTDDEVKQLQADIDSYNGQTSQEDKDTLESLVRSW